jgi:hypothetical protein
VERFVALALRKAGLPMINLEEHSDAAALIGRLFLSSMFLLFGCAKLIGYVGAVA